MVEADSSYLKGQSQASEAERLKRLAEDREMLCKQLQGHPDLEKLMLNEAIDAYKGILERTGMAQRGVARNVKEITGNYWNRPFDERIGQLANLRSVQRETRTIPTIIRHQNPMVVQRRGRLP